MLIIIILFFIYIYEIKETNNIYIIIIKKKKILIFITKNIRLMEFIRWIIWINLGSCTINKIKEYFIKNIQKFIFYLSSIFHDLLINIQKQKMG